MFKTNGYSYVTLVSDTDSEAIYDVAFKKGDDDPRRLYIGYMDGTELTASGLAITAAVTNKAVNSYGVQLNDFYREGRKTVRVTNVEPFVSSPRDGDVHSNMVAYTEYYITYYADDVKSDLGDSSITVRIDKDDTPSFLTTNLWNGTGPDGTGHTLSIGEFLGDDGRTEHIVKVFTKDKDMGRWSEPITLKYYVIAEKNVELRACGPGDPSTWGSGRYSAALGLGEGRVHIGTAPPHKVQNFTHYSSTGSASIDLYMRGYKVDGGPDNGSLLPTPDQKIDKSGAWTKGVTIGDGEYYDYGYVLEQPDPTENSTGLLITRSLC